jgi:DNA-binding transcriptional ArsR family regulator
MRTNAQALVAYEKEHAALLAQRATLDHRIGALTGVIDGLRILCGKPPKPSARRRGQQATGTKALILDALSDGKARSTTDLAADCKVTSEAVRQHLVDLVKAGDVVREGASNATRYRIP